MLAGTPYITGADKCFFSNLLNRRRHAGKHAGTGVMPVLINKNGMTNQSGRDNNPLLNGRYQQEDEREYRQHQGQGRVPQYQRWHFAHCQRTGITTRFMLLPPQDSSIRCYIHCSTSLPLLHFTFVPAAAAPQFDGFREMAFTDQLVKPFVGHTGETGDIVHVDQGIIGTQKYAVVACCSQHGQNVL